MAKADLSHREAGLRAARAGNHDAFKCLQSFLVTFFDFYMHANAVAGNKGRKIGAQRLSQEFFDDQIRHDDVPSFLYVFAHNLGQQFFIFLAEHDLLKKIGAIPHRFFKRRTPPPSPDIFVIARNQNFRHSHPPKIRRTRVVRVIQQSA